MKPLTEKIIKYGITGALALFGTFCYMKSYGYCDYYPIPHDEEYRRIMPGATY